MMRVAAMMLICAASLPAAAQSIYKCTSGGKVSYSEAPCTGGEQKTIAVPDAPPPDPHTAERLARQKALVADIEKERSAERARAVRPVAARKTATPQQQRCDRMRLQLKWMQEDLRKAAGPATEPLRQKAERQLEAIEVECQP